MGLSSKQVSADAQEWAEQSLLQATPVKPQNQQKEPPLKCPRCDSMNTKFCYYNNYNKSQPRYYCKSCKRHWTNGGNLRDVPVGGNRRNKRLKMTKQDQDDTETKLLSSTLSLPFSLPNLSFSTSENTPSSSSTYISGGFQATDDLCGSSFVPNNSASVPLSCSSNAVDYLSDWSWDEFNALLSAGMRHQWDDFETEVPTN